MPGASNFSDRVLLAARPLDTLPGYPAGLQVGIRLSSHCIGCLHGVRLWLGGPGPAGVARRSTESVLILCLTNARVPAWFLR